MENYGTYVCGDIHGCLEQFENLLDKINLDSGFKKLILLGDYIDRGPNSKGVIDKIIELQKKYGDKIIPLSGNHEDMCLHYYQQYEIGDYNLSRAWSINGGQQTCMSYHENKVSQDHLDWMKSLRIRYEDDNFHYVHAGFNPHIELQYQLDYDMMWIRYDFIYSKKDFGNVVVYGHTTVENDPVIEDNKICLDTGCVYGYKLTCMRMEDRKIWQVNGYTKELVQTRESEEF